MDITAFQLDAFQSGAFQQEVATEYWAFQTCAFQWGAFQVEECTTPIVVDTRQGRGSFVKFRPVRRGAAVLAPVAAQVKAGVLAAVGHIRTSQAVSQAAAVQLGVLAAVAGTIRLSPRGETRASAAVRLEQAQASAGIRILQPVAGAAIAPHAATATGHLRRLQPEAAGVAGVYPQFAGGRLYAVYPTAVQNLTDEELIGIFLRARRKDPLTGRVNHL